MSQNAWTLEHVALAAASLGAWSWDRALDQLTWSERAYELFGTTPTEFGHRYEDFLALVHTDDRVRVQQEIARVLESNENGQEWNQSFRAARPGRATWLSSRGRVFCNAQGHAVRLAGVIQDVSAERDAERERIEHEALMHAALEASLFAVVVLRPDGRITYCNELAAELLGLSRSAVEARCYDSPLFSATDGHGAPWPKEKFPFVRVLASGEPVHGVEHHIERPDGRRVTLRINATPIKNERGDVRLVVCSFEDVTERRAIEDTFREAQKMDAIGRLAGGVAHDFNNVMTAILSFVSLARNDLKDEASVLAHLDGITEVGQRAVQLTRQLLLLGRRELTQPVYLDARHEVAAAARLVKRILAGGIQVHVEICDEPCWVRMDPNQLQQVLLNLAVNARDALAQTERAGGGATTLSVQRMAAREDSAAFVSIRVTDNGRGMDALTMRRAFEPFFTTKPAHEGTGLGLSTCHGIITQAGGRISLASEPGLGTRVDIELPETVPSASEARSCHVPASDGGQGAGFG